MAENNPKPKDSATHLLEAKALIEPLTNSIMGSTKALAQAAWKLIIVLHRQEKRIAALEDERRSRGQWGGP